MTRPPGSQTQDTLYLLKILESCSNYRIIAVDLPGSGRSQPQPRTYTASYYEDDAASCAALLHELGTTPAHLIGFSDGGEVALFMAALTPDLVRSVITWGAAGRLNDPEGQLRAVMQNLIDQPIPPLQEYRDFLVDYYGEDNAPRDDAEHCAGHERHHRWREAGRTCLGQSGHNHLPCVAHYW